MRYMKIVRMVDPMIEKLQKMIDAGLIAEGEIEELIARGSARKREALMRIAAEKIESGTLTQEKLEKMK